MSNRSFQGLKPCASSNVGYTPMRFIYNTTILFKCKLVLLSRIELESINYKLIALPLSYRSIYQVFMSHLTNMIELMNITVCHDLINFLNYATS